MKLFIKKAIQTVLLTTILSTLSSAQAVESSLWQQFKTAKSNGTEPTLPDFSYAGYEYSEKPIIDTSTWTVFDVSTYGAFPDDDQYDDVEVQAAINAAEAHTSNGGKAIVQFEAGQYKVSPNQDTNQYISIQGSNILLRGKGTGNNGTIIFVDKPKLGADPDRYYGKHMFKISPQNNSEPMITTIIADAPRETFSLQVEDATHLSVGQKVLIRLYKNQNQLGDYLGDTETGAEWDINSGMHIREIHTVKSINEKTITLREPLHITIKKSYNATVNKITMLENVGIEDIHFLGNWPSYGETFIHHKLFPNGEKDNIHDYGWTALQMELVHNGWINNVEFKDFNQCLFIRTSSAVTVSDVLISGQKAHTSINVSQSYGVLVKDSQDIAGHHHGPGVAQRNAGAVYLRYKMKDGQNIDSHGGGPYVSLYDNVGKGHFDKNGGSHSSYPHHLKYFVFWNFELSGGPDSYNFWRPHQRNGHTYLQPYFSGLHGKSVSFEADTYAANESPGIKVYPDSLFEAQLGLRMLPDYRYCCEAGTSKTFDLPVDIAYGAEGQYHYKYGITGKIDFDDATFGAPAQGGVKSVFYRTINPSPAAPTVLNTDLSPAEFDVGSMIKIDFSNFFKAENGEVIEFTITNIPTGLSLIGTELIGQVSTVGDYSFKVKATSINGLSSTRDFDISVVAVKIIPEPMPKPQLDHEPKNETSSGGSISYFFITLLVIRLLRKEVVIN
ncbi:MAG: DUF4955 domain-containing protein [Thalassotalea sp.]